MVTTFFNIVQNLQFFNINFYVVTFYIDIFVVFVCNHFCQTEQWKSWKKYSKRSYRLKMLCSEWMPSTLNMTKLLQTLNNLDKARERQLVDNASLKAELLKSTNELKVLKKSLNNLEQYTRRDCLEIWGIPLPSTAMGVDQTDDVKKNGRKNWCTFV